MTDTLSPPAQILRDLIACPSVTPAGAGALDVLEARLAPLGFVVTRETATSPDTPDIENLYARLGTSGPNLCFAGHTDVVPVGDEAAWTAPPFEGRVVDGFMVGRGAVDMKGGIACWIAALEAHLAEHGTPANASVSLLITGDEEGPAINGTRAILDSLVTRGERIDAAIVGEPTNPDALGDAIKIGRRGSVSGTLTITGKQGHAAYPHLADNAARGVVALAAALMASWDEGTDDFEPTNLEVTSIDMGNAAFNVVAAKATARFNIRFNDTWTADSVKAEIERRLAAAASTDLRPDRPPVMWALAYEARPSHVFRTQDEVLIGRVADAVEAETGRRPALSTGGGTSDARFIKDVCPVVEFGLVGQTMHQVDERVRLSDLDKLTAIYGRIIATHAGTS
ncbi:succinyl-diaminopimelate desuccinylase [Rhizobiaceae bacterium]|nr:succinyl-diaminopimelate desuccinylase [Rhizobiaceae bacterium]